MKACETVARELCEVCAVSWSRPGDSGDRVGMGMGIVPAVLQGREMWFTMIIITVIVRHDE